MSSDSDDIPETVTLEESKQKAQEEYKNARAHLTK
jgi:hypothetical protein